MQEVMGTIKARIVQYTVIQVYAVISRFPFLPCYWSKILMNSTNFNGKSRKYKTNGNLDLSHCTLLKKSKAIPRSQRCSYTNFTDTEIIRTIWKTTTRQS